MTLPGASWGNKLREFAPARQEGPHRFHSLLREIAQGHALVYGRRQLTPADLAVVVKVALSSMPEQYAAVYHALSAKAEGASGPVELTNDEVKAALRVKHPDTARKVMEKLGQYGVLEYVPGPYKTASVLRPLTGWEWCTFTGLDRIDEA